MVLPKLKGDLTNLIQHVLKFLPDQRKKCWRVQYSFAQVFVHSINDAQIILLYRFLLQISLIFFPPLWLGLRLLLRKMVVFTAHGSQERPAPVCVLRELPFLPGIPPCSSRGPSGYLLQCSSLHTLQGTACPVTSVGFREICWQHILSLLLLCS